MLPLALINITVEHASTGRFSQIISLSHIKQIRDMIQCNWRYCTIVCVYQCCRSPSGWWRLSGSGRSLCSSVCRPLPGSSSPALWFSHTHPRCAQCAWKGPGHIPRALGALSARHSSATQKTHTIKICHLVQTRWISRTRNYCAFKSP